MQKNNLDETKMERWILFVEVTRHVVSLDADRDCVECQEDSHEVVEQLALDNFPQTLTETRFFEEGSAPSRFVHRILQLHLYRASLPIHADCIDGVLVVFGFGMTNP